MKQPKRMNRYELQMSALDRAEALEQNYKELAQHIKILNQFKWQIEQIELRFAAKIANEKDAIGKPLFPNETARKAELQSRLAVNEEYKNNVDQYEFHKDNKEEVMAAIETLKAWMHALDIATR